MVGLECLGRDSGRGLFVVLREGLALDAALTRRIKDAIRTALSARLCSAACRDSPRG